MTCDVMSCCHAIYIRHIKPRHVSPCHIMSFPSEPISGNIMLSISSNVELSHVKCWYHMPCLVVLCQVISCRLSHVLSFHSFFFCHTMLFHGCHNIECHTMMHQPRPVFSSLSTSVDHLIIMPHIVNLTIPQQAIRCHS